MRMGFSPVFGGTKVPPSKKYNQFGAESIACVRIHDPADYSRFN